MGADLTIENAREEGRRAGRRPDRATLQLRGVEVPPERAPSMIDEYPILVGGGGLRRGRDGDARRARASRQGNRPDRGDRSRARRLRREGLGGGRRSDGAWLWARGCEGRRQKPRRSWITGSPWRSPSSGMAAQEPVTIDDAGPIATSFPILQRADDRFGRGSGVSGDRWLTALDRATKRIVVAIDGPAAVRQGHACPRGWRRGSGSRISTPACSIARSRPRRWRRAEIRPTAPWRSGSRPD